MGKDTPFDTIIAPATPPGRGGVAILRLSGPNVKALMLAVLHKELSPRQACYLPFYDNENNTVDEGIAIFFPGPHSFTGEDVLELHTHGGPIIIDVLMESILKNKARLARPGEFSERAFLNGKLDLAQAEAIADLIDASSKEAAKAALRSLQGEFSHAIQCVNEKIIQLRMFVEAAIDFTDEEIDFLTREKMLEKLEAILEDLHSLKAKAKQGSLLREGFTAIIMGQPNVGKSSLLNRLSGNNVAIVTDIPGTTRDLLRNQILIDDIPMHLIDTAGLRDSDDPVEQEGIRRAYEALQEADIIFYMIGVNEMEWLLPKALEKKKADVVFLRNKIDLLNEAPATLTKEGMTMISLSAKTGAGFCLLKQFIKSKLGFSNDSSGIYLARRRHLDALNQALYHLNESLTQLNISSLELAAEELRLAQQSLHLVSGEFTTDDLLGKIFSTFCVGK